MTLRHTLLVGLGLLTISAAAMCIGAAAPAPASSQALKPPPPPPVTLTWTLDLNQGGTWDQSVQAAANHVEGGFTDWRLPTVAELQAALQDGTYGGTTHPNLNFVWTWSSTTTGNMAFACKLFTDVDGDPIAPSGVEKKKHVKSSLFDSKFVRP